MYDEIKKIIDEAESVLICAGAGMGVDSGLPDFRGNKGFWNAYPPYKKLGLDFTDMANPQWFETKPEFAWGFYGHRLNLYRTTVPHRGFEILLDFVNKKEDYFIFTSNVDGQFQKAGFSDEKIVECHGSIHHFQCSKTCPNIFSSEGMDIDVNEETMIAEGKLPRCPICGNIARPNILMFGDWGWNSKRTDEQYERMKEWLQRNYKIIIIEIGAGKAVPTVRNFSENVVRNYGARLIRINTRDADVPKRQIGLNISAKRALELILKNNL